MSRLRTLSQQMIDTLHPVGSIYISMDNTAPETLFGGTWEQIKDRFIYCSDTPLQTGGSKKITLEQLPAHSHSISHQGYYNTEQGSGRQCVSRNTIGDDPIDSHYRVSATGGGQDYMPPFITVMAWFRTA